MDKLIRKELIGRVYKPYGYTSKTRYVILGVRKSRLWNYYEILIGKLEYESPDRLWSSITCYSWITYMGSRHICFDGRGTRRAISRCIKSGQLDKLHFHTGKRIKMNTAKVYDRHCHYYEDYINECISKERG